MKFFVVGLDDKEKIALNKLIKAFDRNNELTDNKEETFVQLMTHINEEIIEVQLKTNQLSLTRQTKLINTLAYDKKYLKLACFYEYLVKVTKKTLRYGVLTGIRPTKLVRSYMKRYQDEVIRELLHHKFMITYDKCDLLMSIVKKEEHLLKQYPNFLHEVSIYINIPFCLSRCSYCSFSSYPQDYQFVSRNDYLSALIEEIKGMGDYLQTHQIKITTIYIGGGTPTALRNDELTRLLEAVKEHLLFDEVKEFTLECGRPDSFDEEKLRLMKNYPISRISINPQTFNEATLQKVNRHHTPKDIIDKFELAKKIGFDDINMDLIIGLPHENITDFFHSIDETIALSPESITIHYLAQKKGTQLFNKDLTQELDTYYQTFDYAFDKLKNNTYQPYYLYRQKNIAGNLENVGYSKKGYESLYNILMIEERQNIIGLGCHASSKFLNHKLILNPKDLISYMKSYQDYFSKKLQALEETLGGK